MGWKFLALKVSQLFGGLFFIWNLVELEQVSIDSNIRFIKKFLCSVMLQSTEIFKYIFIHLSKAIPNFSLNNTLQVFWVAIIKDRMYFFFKNICDEFRARGKHSPTNTVDFQHLSRRQKFKWKWANKKSSYKINFSVGNRPSGLVIKSCKAICTEKEKMS